MPVCPSYLTRQPASRYFEAYSNIIKVFLTKIQTLEYIPTITSTSVARIENHTIGQAIHLESLITILTYLVLVKV